ncbi:hypothetical protein [Aeromicrobium sp.]|uniref:hypothetical protein n=1 Tax=Aeromicrobium sp. TaxID=1871063 RepID=UPI0019A91E39|nr:hypothetical protein [Aeromicrobium sp.]MBC7632739.1 hypothetical protein [Aeromicrobium sp.]
MSSFSVLRRSASATAVMIALGVASGFVWLLLANPAEWEVRSTGIVLTEAAAKGQFSVIVTFVLVGAGVSLAWGSVSGWLLRDLGWLITPLVVVVTLAAAVIAWRVGVGLGPPEPASVTGPSIGDKLPATLAVDGITPFLVWPIFGLLGVLLASWLGRKDDAGDVDKFVAS